MANESVAGDKLKLPDEETLLSLKLNNWVCDYEAHRTLWEAQSICRMLSERMQEGPGHEVELFAIEGIERLLCDVIRRAGWAPAGFHGEGA